MWIGSCCGGCFLLFLGCIGSGGYLAYLEEGADRYEPGEELVTQAYAADTPFNLFHTWSGTGRRKFTLWAVVTAPASPDPTMVPIVDGRASCGSYGSPYPRTIHTRLQPGYLVKRYERTATQVTAWVEVDSEYGLRSGGTVTCAGTLRVGVESLGGSFVPLQTATTRLVLTGQPQRPSDWVD